MIITRSRLLRKVELWFDEPDPAEKFDVIIRRQAPTHVRNAANDPFVTLLIDLQKSSEEIFAAFDRNTRSKINKAVKEDGLSFDIVDKPTREQLAEFVRFYNQFAAGKALEPVWEPLMEASLASGLLTFSRVSQDGEVLIWHALITYGSRVTVTHSASHFRDASPETRNVVGRANRFHHWQEMLAYKSRGLKTYDMGGWYAGTENASLLMVNRFKEEFGGVKSHEFNSVEDRSVRAKLVAWCKKTFAKKQVHQQLQTRDAGT
jgi:hypothetical protein